MSEHQADTPNQADERPYCTATTRSGKPCRNRALPDSDFCRMHKPDDSPPEQSATPPSAPELAAAPAAPADQSEPHIIETMPDTLLAPPPVTAITHTPEAAALDPLPPGEHLVDLVRQMRAGLEQLPPPRPLRDLPLLRQEQRTMEDLVRPELWEEAGAALHYYLRDPLLFLQRRLEGTYRTDPYGTDLDMIAAFRPLLLFLYRVWWRVSAEGLEHIPNSGRALLVSNHSGVLPWDGAMIASAVFEEHPAHRLVRNLFLDWFSAAPLIAPIFTSLGQQSGQHENAMRLLEEEELLCTFPEGVKGVGKLFPERYHLARFGRGGFVQIALRTGAPLIPVAVFGAEEIYPLVGNFKPLAKLIGSPYFPVTPFFPWMGFLGMLPLPTRWSITFCPPISTREYGPEAADDPLIVFMLTEQVRQTIQHTLNAKLAARTNLF